MQRYIVLTAAAALWASTSSAHAATLASGFLLSAISDSSAACYIRNVGTQQISLEVSLFDGSGALSPTFQNCNDAPLVPGKACVVLKSNLGGVVTCIAKATGSVKPLRGTVELRNDSDNQKVIIAEDLR